ncbi:MAG: ribonuclease R [Eubacteriales bacterium]|nr:ribonuclease R [Eubacteriales bacterium]
MEELALFEQRKEMIRTMIYDENYIPLKFKEMAYLMDVPHKDKEKLREVLESLVTEGSVELTARGKYIRPENKNLTGVFSAHPRGFGFVAVEGEPEDIFIPEPYVNGAAHKDVVKVKVSGAGGRGKRREGVVLKILERGADTLVGTFEESRSFGFVRPDDAHYTRDIFIPKRHCGEAAQNDKVVVKILDYGSDKKNPEGRVIEIIGSADDPSTDVTSIVRAYGIEEEFSQAALREAGRISQEVVYMQGEKREDYRSLLTVTIDGEDARDLDDAITLERREGGYLLGVHIADVSQYVTEGSPLDKDALNRGTSVYLCDRVIPMLPRELSNGICSLNEGVDRFALSCMMEVDGKGNVTSHKITESVIRVDRRMSYTGVQAILEGREHPEGDRKEIRELCALMKEAASVLKEKRRKRGSIDFDFPESKIVLDEKGYPVDIHAYERNWATDIIEDFMLLANETVAEEYFWQEIPFVFRTHEEPDTDKIERLDTFIRNFGFYMKTGREHFHPKEIQKLLFSLEGEPEEALISRLALRSMKQAKYTTMNVGHFGLSTQYYCHFTSPIRRYPDLQIHRIIKENIHGKLNGKKIQHYETILPFVAEHSSKMERRADEAEREVEKLKKVEYMAGFLGESFDGVISGVTARGLYVELHNTVEGMVPVESLLDDYYMFDESRYCLEGRDTGRIFTLGQKARVKVQEVNKARKTIDFVLEEFSSDAGWQAKGDWSEPEEEEILKNEWMDEKEAEALLQLYANKKIEEI